MNRYNIRLSGPGKMTNIYFSLHMDIFQNIYYITLHTTNGVLANNAIIHDWHDFLVTPSYSQKKLDTFITVRGVGVRRKSSGQRETALRFE